jgi:hypothetical protein
MASAPTHKTFATRSAPHLLALALCAFSSSGPTTFASDDLKTFSAFEIEVGSRTGFFPSPGYKVSILGSGRVNYHGYDRVHWKGKRHARISQDAVEQLVEHVRASKFLDLPGSYENGPCLELDRSEGSLRVRLDGREKSVGTCGAPPIVDQLMDGVVSVARVWRWVVLDPDELRHKIAHGWPVSEHMPKIMEDAISWDAAELIRILVSNGADANGLNSDNERFLMGAVRSGHLEAARVLLEVGADWKIEEDYGGENPAINAGFRSPEMVKLFLDKGANVNTVSSGGHTMLMNAAEMANIATVKLLVDAGAEVNIHNKQGESALSIAEARKKEYSVGAPETARSFQPIIDYLLAHGAVR